MATEPPTLSASQSRAFAGAASANPAQDRIDQSLLPVFQQSWWLEVARAKKSYREAKVFRGGVLVGILPYTIRRTKLGLGWGAAPDWSHIGGPIVSSSLSEREKSEVLDRLIAKLPSFTSYGFLCGSYTSDAVLIRRAFTNAGFTYFAEKTYCQAPQHADVLGRMSRKHRLHILAARRALDVIEIAEREFIDFYAQNLAEAGLGPRQSLDTARELIAKGRASDPPQVKVFAARMKTAGAPLDAAIACAWDNKRYYYWMSTRRRSTGPSQQEAHPDAIKLLIVTAMEHARNLGLIFDTDGCSTPGTQKLYRDLLQIPTEDYRDAFERITPFHRWCLQQQDRLETLSPIRYLKRKLKLAPTPWLPGRAPPPPR